MSSGIIFQTQAQVVDRYHQYHTHSIPGATTCEARDHEYKLKTQFAKLEDEQTDKDKNGNDKISL